jgi:hypothetical protein
MAVPVYFSFLNTSFLIGTNILLSTLLPNTFHFFHQHEKPGFAVIKQGVKL